MRPNFLKLFHSGIASGALTMLASCATSAPATAPQPIRAPLAQLRWSLDSLVSDRRFRNAQLAVLIVNPASGDTLYSRNAGKSYMPASNQKILTSAVALTHLGAAYRFNTVLATRGAQRDSVLDGDLIVIGNGDPTLSDRVHASAMNAMLAIADSLRARGMRRVTGSLRPGGNAFPGSIYGNGWEYDDLTGSSGAPTDELLYNEGMVRTVIHRDRGDTIELEATRNPANAYLAALDTALRARGITVALGVSDSIAEVTAPLDTIYSFESPQLSEILKYFMKPSQNQIGEVLIKALGKEKKNAGLADSGAVVIRDQLGTWGVDTSSFVVYDGSGLSRHNLVTAEGLVKILVAMQRDTAFYESMPIAGVDGTIRNRMRNTPAAGNLRAKTGTVEFVRSLSGYVTTAGSQRLVFSLLSNHFTVPVSEVTRLQDAIGVLLATYRGQTR